ncbi:MAG: fluoride efflux transporter CrcB [Anaerolineales bacterium]|nr:fluoride efflux transporter CrcB [Anaerolineae bacterium]PWB73397.1 MAG: fluoride efflux transporter CrcB [Anaerolineales bacterium]
MPSLLSVIYVALGGALGSVSRYLLAVWAQTVSKSIDFPYGTLTVNLIGCFVIGFLSQLAETRGAFTPESRALVFIGVLGGFTTFSSFGNDTVNLFRDGETFNALANVGANVILGLSLVWLGRAVAYWIWR